MALVTRAILLIIFLLVTAAALVMMMYMFTPLETTALVSKTMALQISNRLSNLMTAPNGTTSYVRLPAIECRVIIEAGMVNVSAHNHSYMSPYLINSEKPVKITVKRPIMCDDENIVRIIFTKTEDSDGNGFIEIDLEKL